MKFVFCALCASAVGFSPPPETVTNSLGMRLTLVPAGEYRMGAAKNKWRTLNSLFPRCGPPNNQQDLPTEAPQHPVRISKAFYMGAHEVTRGQFRKFVDATGYRTDAEKGGPGGRGFDRQKGVFENAKKYAWKNPGFPQTGDHPVVLVSWNDAAAFCAWLGKKEGKTYRLPTEAEWEYACRAGTTSWLNCGDKPSIVYRHANLADVDLEKAHPGHTMRQRLVDVKKEPGDGHVYTAPVGTYRPNAFGLYDMHGNVWEWCRDRYQRFYYRNFDPRKVKKTAVDPQGPGKSDEDGDWRVLRGGSWVVSPVVARASSRLWNDQPDAFCYAGFRVVRVQ